VDRGVIIGMKTTTTRRRGDTETGRKSRTACLVTVALIAAACTMKAGREGVPHDVESIITNVSDDIEQERYEKIYNEAADEWRRDSTLDQSSTVFKIVKAKLGRVDSRTFHSATEESKSGGPLPGHSFIVTYETKFERGEGMETFTLVERNGHWVLARYFVNSTALK
jgi:Protein of unknown function (DUF4019)